jgi:signal transduction histidine kinase
MERFSSLRGDRPAVPMVVLTGDWARLSARKARELGADYSVPSKGLQGPTLRQIAHYAMEHRRLVNDLDGQRSKVQEYTGRIAHSLNNELSTILLHADLMKVTMETGAQMEAEDVTAVNESARRAAKLTKELLGFSRQARR